MYIYIYTYCIAGNFRGRKFSQISWFFSHLWKFSRRNSRHAILIMRPVLIFCESFLREMLLSYWSAKVFSLKNFPLYSRSGVEREIPFSFCGSLAAYLVFRATIHIYQININLGNLQCFHYFNHAKKLRKEHILSFSSEVFIQKIRHML